MNSIRSILIVIILTFSGFITISAQNNISGSPLNEIRQEIVRDLKINVQQFSLTVNDKNKLSKKYNLPIEFATLDGGRAELQYFDEFNHPVYYTTFNVDAAATTGISSLKEGGRFGQSLTGKNLIVGVWDERRAKLNHLEFSDRLLQIDGSSLISVHATHVTGTILASGVNPLSRGMAHEAKGWIFDWVSDVAEMLEYSYDPIIRPEGILVSNHSYGIVLGWSRNASGAWVWNGNANIDPNEDYRFGFYSAKSQSLDNITYAKPYYSVVWAAGNDRNDIGNGSRPPDGPEDTIGPEGASKNVFTIGAVNKIDNYIGPESVVMSPFSSWGPVDDGRIKPDLVGVGVQVLSSAFTGTDDNRVDSYASLSGTSMAAPNVSGALVLLQELFSNRNAGRYMWSSALKALTIHTAKEAGPALGPDYMYGWGILDADKAGELLINRDEVNNILKQDIINNGEVIEIDIFSNGEGKIKATLAWTDPAGTPVSTGNLLNPKDLMLVNDLDMRIFDPEGNEFFPWTLDPSRGSNAVGIRNQDNFRDNVEQILIDNPSHGKYTLRISHKGELRNNLQEYSLVITTTSDQFYDKTLYWIGNKGNWEDVNNWSFEKNGVSAGVSPDSKTKVVIDNEDTSTEDVIIINNDIELFSLAFFGKRKASIMANSYKIKINNQVIINNSEAKLLNGIWEMVNVDQEELNLDFNSAIFRDSQLLLNNGVWNINSLGDFDQLIINNSIINLLDNDLRVTSADLTAADIRSDKITINFRERLQLRENVQLPNKVSLSYSGTDTPGALIISEDRVIDDALVSGNNLLIDSKASYKKFSLLNGNVDIVANTLTVDSLAINKNGGINIGDNLSLVVNNGIKYIPEGNGQFQLTSNTSGTFIHDIYTKYCLPDVNIRNVNLSGVAVINLVGNSSIANGENWLNLACEEVLFADFTSQFACENSITTFRNASQGSIDDYLWSFSDLGTSKEMNPEFIFTSAGEYDVQLRIANAESTQAHTKRISVIANPIQKPSIVINNNTLVSFTSGTSYQWYQNGNRIEGATKRSFMAEGDGIYQVAVFSDICNYLSDAVVITAIEREIINPEGSIFGVKIGANPTSDNINIYISNNYIGPVEFQVISMNGAIILQQTEEKSAFDMNKVIELNTMPGVYLLRLNFGNTVVHRKIIKK